MTGRIVKAVSDFYYVYAEGVTYACKAKGVFKKRGLTPLVGDQVEFERTHTDDIEGHIIRVMDRGSHMTRPSVANVDQVLIVFAITAPKPNLYLLDRFLVIMENMGQRSIICFNKSDTDSLGQSEEYLKIYQDLYPVIITSTVTGEGMDSLRDMLKGRLTALAGPSGVGKSSITNALCGQEAMETGAISTKNLRGKQTTRHTQLIPIDEDTFLVDTPGFSSTDISAVNVAELPHCFPEFVPFLGGCRFDDCIHDREPDCRIKQAVDDGIITAARYENYIQMLGDLR